MRRESYRERALVVRSYDFGEADRIIVLFTRGRGIVRGVAKGVRRAKSRFGSRLQPFVELDVQLYRGRNLESITAADTVAYFGAKIIDDVTRFSAASSILEGVEKLAVGDEPRLFDLTVTALKNMQTCAHPVAEVDTFLLQGMNIAGWAPSLFDCAQCGASGPHHAFHPSPGGAVCVHCRPLGVQEVDPETLHMMWLMAQGHRDAVAEIGTPERYQQAHALIRSHLSWHVERGLASLNVLDQV
ncbi:DNA repair protein RecO [Corynebacterium diphtheriae]|uniref:DNA repair protein RecO n=1 Tax=Corynebacterium diphtheriae TaxID=1717 RepID=UPI0009680680|nr:DNA repair protein RecO [Corynebacterium diphtheriae]OLN18782.1 DNA repair protein RecO [Corynebacterium diphtheriae]RKW83929.1 DNA repair protein RecO [Corynebacterium diphtheriae]RKW90587.1 DNA repair protein RecO [Corynebacterium diphtheriae]RKX06971.1 DNA repair protein RecO [Corynebacterium diphtheriae]RNF47822.1 DNA repair protein RecO [Corynebacterium diphtheriae]